VDEWELNALSIRMDEEDELWQWELNALRIRMENAMEVKISIWRESDRIRNTEVNIKMLDRDDHPEYYWAWSNDDNPDFDPRTCTYELKYRVFRRTDTTKGIPITEPMSRAEAIAKCEQIIKLTKED
jgi:hypothetical protein